TSSRTSLSLRPPSCWVEPCALRGRQKQKADVLHSGEAPVRWRLISRRSPHLCEMIRSLSTALLCGCLVLFLASIHGAADALARAAVRSEEHTSELQSRENLVCRLLLE